MASANYNHSNERYADTATTTMKANKLKLMIVPPSQANDMNRRTIDSGPAATPFNKYPVHLNPFYKDDQHKRLRFIKLALPKKLQFRSSSSSASETPQRRSSFSFEGMRDIWKLRSFRGNNKATMPLHVTKTSESPPELRRQFDRSSMSPTDRATINDPFLRNVRHRASLQNMNGSSNINNNEDPFRRNATYRNTMVTTTVPRSKGMAMRHGTSQISVNSTNPFDEDYDDGMSVSGFSVASLPTRPRRMKRRAPAPPTMPSIAANQVAVSESATVTENGTSIKPRMIVTSPSTEEGNLVSEPIIDGEAKNEEATVGQPLEDLTKQIDNLVSVLLTEKSDDNANDGGGSHKNTSKVVTSQVKPNSEVLRIVESVEDIPQTVQQKQCAVESGSEANRRSRSCSSDNTINIKNNSSPQGRDPYQNVVVEMEKYDVRFVPLKGDNNNNYIARDDEDDAKDACNKQLDGQKSVKDIIESINKSQSLLRINHEQARRSSRTSSTSADSMNTRMRELERHENQLNEMINEIELEEKVNEFVAKEVPANQYNGHSIKGADPKATVTTTAAAEDDSNEIPLVIRDLQTHISKQEETAGLFEKCKRREWDTTPNPLPKPKRTNNRLSSSGSP